ncbi:MAG: type II secretion system protein GspD [Opitutales bacterium]
MHCPHYVTRSFQKALPLLAALLTCCLIATDARAQNGSLEGAGKFLPQENLSAVELEEILNIVAARMKSEHGYADAHGAFKMPVEVTPQNIRSLICLTKPGDDGTRILQIGHATFLSQPPHLWVYGKVLKPRGEEANARDVEKVLKIVEESGQQAAKRSENMSFGDLEIGRIKLSYIEADRAMAVLKTMGYNCVEFKDSGKSVGKAKLIEPATKPNTDTLPVVVAMPSAEGVDLVGGSKATKSAFGLTISPSVAEELPQMTAASEMMELLVFYHPAHPNQFAELKGMVETFIDRPARQILIEAMVLEISETGLDTLGVQWTKEAGGIRITNLQLGNIPGLPPATDPAAVLDAARIFGEFELSIEALVQEGQAEILSRPSVLTLDGRQASIRVGEDIPVATSVRGANQGDNIQLDFEYIPVGILLNIRPRMSSSAEEISLQLDGIISAEVPNEELVVFNNDGDEIGRAPRISTRRVQTYSIVNNNTPFIIGGLIAKDVVKEQNRVPVLGNLPLVGSAFRSDSAERLKREVIIVITPFILPEGQVAGRNLPRDEDAFDSFGHQLFRDAYRIRSEDVFDLAFLTQNTALRHLQDLTDRVLLGDSSLADAYPYSRFAGGRLPGEEILVCRQIYEVIKRRQLSQSLESDQILFFVPDDDSESGFSVRFLDNYLQTVAGEDIREDTGPEPSTVLTAGPRRQGATLRLGGNRTESAASPGSANPFPAMDGQAVVMTFYPQRSSLRSQDILSEPVPEISLEYIPDGDTWARRLWELNQPDEFGRERNTIILGHPSNIVRLKRAIILKQAVELNASRKSLTLNNFTHGRLLLLPNEEEQSDRNFLIDADVAKLFYLTELYYPALRRALKEDTSALVESLNDRGFGRFLEDIEVDSIDLPEADYGTTDPTES